jgi:hypothetical protein
MCGLPYSKVGRRKKLTILRKPINDTNKLNPN